MARRDRFDGGRTFAYGLCGTVSTNLKDRAGLKLQKAVESVNLGTAGRKKRPAAKTRTSVLPSVTEPLEARQLLSSVSLTNGVLQLNGNWSSSNNLSSWIEGSYIVGKANSVTRKFKLSSVSWVNAIGGKKADKVWLDPKLSKKGYIWTGDGNDSVYGQGGNDTIVGGNGNDLLCGYGGNDRINGDGGDDSLFGGSGSDTLTGGSGDNMKYNDATGPWDLEGLEPRQLLSSISLSSGVLTITGDSSVYNGQFVYMDGSSLVAKNNSLKKTYSPSSVSSIKITGGDKGDYVWIDPKLVKKSTIYGKSGNDTIHGGSGNDTIYGNGGADKLYGHDGWDKLYGGDGNDSLYGGNGTDTLNGESGDDTLDPGADNGGSSGSSGGGSTPSDSNAQSPNAVITATTSRSIQEGMAFHAHALGSSLGEGTPLTARYQWDFGDSNGKYNKLSGFNAAHFYENPGSYTVRLTITNEDGKVDTATTTVNVSSESRREIYVSSSGSDSNSGSSSSPIRSFSKAVSMLGGSSNVAIYFRRGDSFNVSDGMYISGDNVVVGAYGSGSRPVLKYSGPKSYNPIIGGSDSSDNITVRDLAFDSIYGSSTSDDNMPAGVKPNGHNFTVKNCEFDNLGYAIQANADPIGCLVQDNVAPTSDGIKGYFAWAEGSDHVYLGNYVANAWQHVLRTGGSDGGGFSRLLIAYNDFTNPPEIGVTRGTLTLHTGQYYYVANNKLSKGKVTFGPLGEGDGLSMKSSRTRWGVFENNTINSIMIVEHGAEHLMIRNNVINSNSTFAIQIEGYNSTYGRTVSDVTLANNTAKNTASSGQFLNVQNGAKGLALANNLYVAPSLVTGSNGSAVIYVDDNDLSMFTYIGNNVWADPTKLSYAQGGINYVYDYWSNASGYKTPSEWNAYAVVGTDYFSDVSISSSYAPSSSSVAASAARPFKGVFTDRNGNTRSGSTWTAGAVEV